MAWKPGDRVIDNAHAHWGVGVVGARAGLLNHLLPVRYEKFTIKYEVDNIGYRHLRAPRAGEGGG